MKRIVILGSLLLSQMVAQAYTDQDGAYFGVSFGLSNTRNVQRELTTASGGGDVIFRGKKFDVVGNSAGASGQVNLKTGSARGDNGFRIIAGYRIWERYAFEFTFDNFADSEYRELDGDKMRNSQYAMGVQGVGRFPFVYDNMLVSARMGMSYIRSNLDFRGSFTSGGGGPININSSIKNQNESETNLLYGLGLVYKWNKKADVTFDYIRYNGRGSIDDIDVIQVGMLYHFSGDV